MKTIVSSGQITSNLILDRHESEYVLNGGTAVATTVNAGGLLSVTEGNASATFIASGGVGVLGLGASFDGLTVAAGGTLVEASLYSLNGTISINSAATVIDSGVALVSNARLTTTGVALQTVSGANVTEYVLTGGIVTGAQIMQGATQYIPHGLAIGTTIGAGGIQDIYGEPGGSATETIILSGGVQSDGGYASGTTIEAGGSQIVDGNYVFADATTVAVGGVQTDLYGNVSGTTIASGGLQIVSGGAVSGTTIQAGGTELVSFGPYEHPTVYDTTIDSGGYMLVSNGGYYQTRPNVSGTQVLSGGTLILLNSPKPSGTIVQPGGSVVDQGVVTLSGSLVQSVASKATTGAAIGAGEKQYLIRTHEDSATVQSGGILEVQSGAMANFTSIDQGGLLSGPGSAMQAVVYAGGTISVEIDTKSILSGGVEVVQGYAYETAVRAAGVQQVFSIASGTQISSGGTEFITQGAAARYAVISSGGYQVIDGGSGTSNTDIKSGGTEILLQGKTQIVNDTTLEAGGNVISGGVILLSNDAVVSVASSLQHQTIAAGQQLFVLSSGTLQNARIASGGVVSAMHSGLIKGGTIESGGMAIVQESAKISGASILFGAYLGVISSTASSLQISGGVVDASDSTITGAAIFAGGTLFTVAGNDRDTSIYAGGLELIYNDNYYGNYGSAKSISAVIYAGGSISVLDGATAQDTQIQSGGDLFAQSGSDIKNAMISAGGTIDLTNFYFVSGGAVTLQANDVLTITEGQSSTSLTLAGSYSVSQFHLAPDLNGGTLITLSAAQALDPTARAADGLPPGATDLGLERAAVIGLHSLNPTNGSAPIDIPRPTDQSADLPVVHTP